MWNILCNICRPIPILVDKVWRRNLDYVKNFQARYFTAKNILIYGMCTCIYMHSVYMYPVYDCVNGNSRSAECSSTRAQFMNFTIRSNYSDLSKTPNSRNHWTNSSTRTSDRIPFLSAWVTVGTYFWASMILLWKMASRQLLRASKSCMKAEDWRSCLGVHSRRGMFLQEEVCVYSSSPCLITSYSKGGIYMYMYIHVCICTCTCVYVLIHTCTCTYNFKHYM